MQLHDLLEADARCEERHASLSIAGVCDDSRAVKPGFLFAAVPGTKVDGMSYIPAALAAGAVAILAERAPAEALPDDVALVIAPDVRRALAIAAAKFFGRQPRVIAAVTGTSGKTSVASFTRQIWSALGISAASIGTVGLVTPTEERYGSLTTPNSIELHETLAQLADEGITHLALEASSHGLDQHRLDGVHIAVASFTNVTRDHLDYHLTFAAYLKAKLILFERLLSEDGIAVIDVDHDHAETFVAAAARRTSRVLTVGRRGRDIQLVDCAIDRSLRRWKSIMMA